MKVPGKLLSAACALILATACAQKDDKQDKDESATGATSTSSDPASGGPKPGDIPAPEDVAAAPSDAEKTPSGLARKVLTPGNGEEKPSATDRVSVHYTGWTTDGKMFDSSVKRGRPATFGVNGVIKGWTEGLQLMTKGEKSRFWIPADLAYGEKPGGGRPAGMLVFDVELLDILKAPKAPDDVAAPPSDAKKTSTGLAYKILTAGAGKSPKPDDKVDFTFTGWTTGGQMVGTSTFSGRPNIRPMNRMPMKGWTEALALMKEGGKARFWIPKELAMGERAPAPGVAPGPLTFDLELKKVMEAPKPIEAPEDVGAVPSSAEKTPSGLASRVLQKGSGDKKPAATDTVEVHYTGWTLDGKMFDSSVQRGTPASFPLNRVIKGWTEGLQLMVQGEKRRFWIPAELAYGTNPSGGRPAGMLVFDVELLSIK